ncbi:UDP-N-acetylmuramoyl-L-alanyl-D-glutamate--2,6-diaminopimelate ligase [Natronoflexus pectinivorans]|uniref:UDP-N-acetylmuramoyl-L-alanyl-D-glutamate--2,6-diaminopimelate ligase n=1 Tax=Natronoflexus pectinivorans TaxID=682526 RepID=A0A4R2GAI2_9BACT|nr:UDP-N-acetylmuramoyl-L-alanyl-D-glutamate--2,6-diaminopimelate ligase [Natronoflexus pectinivorans]TCO04957.1 UDP-N-acetylmuramoylalanyl-D-glutamate--2,6-diaminopimelate ligase [Natronoflexus pectinivorans]
MKQFIDYIAFLEEKKVVGNGNPKLDAIVFDSRKVNATSLFVAMKGTVTDGHKFIPAVFESGCRAVVCQELPEAIPDDAMVVQVRDSHEALAKLAAFHFDFPSDKMKVVGVTGTNGKTTVATLLYRLALELGYKVGLCSTVANFINDVKLDASHTTPDAVTLQGLMRQMVDEGCEYCFMEVSSHALDQKRVAGINYRGGIYTNLTHDHLDYHKTFDAYLKAKKTFFDNMDKEAFALVNCDDKNGMVMLQNCKASHSTFSLREMADFRGRIIESLFEGMQLEFNGKEMWTPFIGRFNASNLLAVYGAARLLGWDEQEVLRSLSSLKSVDGRFETIRSKTGVTGVVDYAHTPDALINVLEALNQIRKPENELITVVGAGGDRDATKRPIMAAEAVKSSSRVILTSDNPRSENPETIIEQMMEGVLFSDRIKVICITNRKEAIKTACTLAKKGDVILVAGKGHETYQEVKGVRSHFDDREIIREYFEQL